MASVSSLLAQSVPMPYVSRTTVERKLADRTLHYKFVATEGGVEPSAHRPVVLYSSLFRITMYVGGIP